MTSTGNPPRGRYPTPMGRGDYDDIQSIVSAAMATAQSAIQQQIGGMINDLRRDLGGRLEKLEGRFDSLDDQYVTRREYTILQDLVNRQGSRMERIDDQRVGETAREYRERIDLERQMGRMAYSHVRDDANSARSQLAERDTRQFTFSMSSIGWAIALLGISVDIIMRVTGH